MNNDAASPTPAITRVTTPAVRQTQASNGSSCARLTCHPSKSVSDANPTMTAQRGKGHHERPGDDAREGPIAGPGPPSGRWRLGLQFGGKSTLQPLGHRPRGLRGATDSFDFLLLKFEGGEFLDAAADET